MALKMVDLPEQKQMTKNIMYTFLSASEDDMVEGLSWYQEAFNECVRIADSTGVPFTLVVPLVSVISPSIVWDGNITAPEKIIDLWKKGVPVEEWEGFNIYPANLHKAVAVLNGDTSVVKGLKVNAFMQNIFGSDKYVTIDRWAIRVALDNPHLPKDKIVPSGIKVYNAIAAAYKEAAFLLGEMPVHDVQAVVWTVLRNSYNGRVRKQKEKDASTEQQASAA